MPDHVSASQLGTYAGCGMKYKLSRIEHVPQTPQGAFLGGRAVHRAIEEAELGEWWAESFDDGEERMTFAFVAEFTKQTLEVHSENVRWGGRKTRDNPHGEDDVWWLKFGGPSMLRRYVELRREDAAAGIVPWGGSPLGSTEMAVAAYTPTGKRVEAIVDSFLIDAGEPIIRDWKTGRPGGANPMQAAIYAWAINQTLGIEVTKAQYVYLRAPDRGRQLEAVDLSHLLSIVPAQLDSLVRGIDAEVFLLNPSSFCISCGVNWACPHGSTLPGVSAPRAASGRQGAEDMAWAHAGSAARVGADTTSSGRDGFGEGPPASAPPIELFGVLNPDDPPDDSKPNLGYRLDPKVPGAFARRLSSQEDPALD